MAIVYAVLGVLLLFVAPGLALLRWFRPKDGAVRFDLVEAVVLVPCLSVLVASLVAIVLAEVGQFRLWLLFLVVGAVSCVVWVARGRGAGQTVSRGIRRVEAGFLVVVVATGIVLYFRPHEYLFGGWDPSAYVTTGASIERTGGILYHDEAFAALPRETQDAFSHHRQGLEQRFPAMLIGDHETGLITPQFHHLYPTWLAVFRAVGGDRLVLYANPLFGVLSVLMLFLLCRRFLPNGAAVAATVLLALNLTQVWQARFPTAEILAQLCTLTMLYLLMLYWETGSAAAALLAMLAMGMAMHARFDAVLLVPLVALLVYAHNLVRWRARDWLLVAGGLVAAAHIVLHSVFISFLYRPGLQFVTQRPGLFAAIGAVVLVVLVIIFAGFRLWPDKLSAWVTGPWLRGAVVVLVLALAFYAYFVRPYLGEAAGAGGALRAGSRQNFAALGWFLTPVGLALAVGGGCLVVAKARSFTELTLVVVGVVMTVVYAKIGFIESFYMWAARRFVPVVIPLLCIFAGYALAVVTAGLGRLRPVACGAVAVVIAAVPLVRERAIVATRDNEGTLDFVATVADELDPDAVYICNHYWLAMPLRTLYGLETYAVSDPTREKCRVALEFAARTLPPRIVYSEAGPDRKFRGRAVYFIGQDRPHIFPHLAFVPVEGGRYVFRSERLEQSAGLPRRAEPVELEVVVYKIEYVAWAPDDTADVDLTWEFEPDWFRVGEGFLREDVKRIKIVETEDGRRLDPTDKTAAADIDEEYAWRTGPRSGLWIPYDPERKYVAEIRLSGLEAQYGVRIEIAGRVLATVEPEDSFHTVTVEIPAGIETGTPRRALLEFVSLAPADEAAEARGAYLDRIRLRSVEADTPAE